MALQPALAQLLKAAVTLARKRAFQHLLWVSDRPLPDELAKVPLLRRKLVQAVTSESQRQAIVATHVPAVVIPAFSLSRAEKLKLALVAGAARDLFGARDTLLALVGPGPTLPPDSLHVVTVGSSTSQEDAAIAALRTISDESSAEVVESLVQLAVTIGAEGWEGTPLGALFVYGDSSRVLEKSRQLTLNPFQGYPEQERNLLDPSVREAVRAFATLDGAFIVRDDGVVLAAGRYLNFEEKARRDKLPLGLGARHMAAAATSAATEAMCVVVSQTSGTVRVFKKGKIALEITPYRRRG